MLCGNIDIEEYLPGVCGFATTPLYQDLVFLSSIFQTIYHILAGLIPHSWAAKLEYKNKLYKIWNRMSSGCYFFPAVRAVEIPKKNGGVRTLGVPTVSDRIAQMVAKIYLEPVIEPHFHADSYGYRPGKSAIDAVGVTRTRCWSYDWLIEFDIKGLFDNIDHELLMKAVRKHTDCKWVIVYIERWLRAPFRMSTGELVERTAGTPQGGVISPLLANLFLHYAFDAWMAKNHPENPWARYADDGVVHCRTREEAEKLLAQLGSRFLECKLELHPEKTKIIYCKDDKRRGTHPETKFDFLGYTFRGRGVKTKDGKLFTGFIPAVSGKASKAMRQTIRGWKIHLRSDTDIEKLAKEYNKVLVGWNNYYARFCKSDFHAIFHHMNKALIRWAMRKYKKLAGHKTRATKWLRVVAAKRRKLFTHWQMGILPTVG